MNLNAASTPHGPAAPPQRPQERPEGPSESPAASEPASGAHRGAQPFATHPHHDSTGVEWDHPGAPEDCDLPDCADPMPGESVGEGAPEYEAWVACLEGRCPEECRDGGDSEPATPAPDGLREQIARAIHRYDNHHALTGNDLPSHHHYGEADAVMPIVTGYHREQAGALRDRMQRLSARVGELEARDTPGWRDRAERAEAARDRVLQLAASLRADATHARTVGAIGLARGYDSAATRIDTALNRDDIPPAP